MLKHPTDRKREDRKTAPFFFQQGRSGADFRQQGQQISVSLGVLRSGLNGKKATKSRYEAALHLYLNEGCFRYFF
jgi:hypothetical protein